MFLFQKASSSLGKSSKEMLAPIEKHFEQKWAFKGVERSNCRPYPLKNPINWWNLLGDVDILNLDWSSLFCSFIVTKTSGWVCICEAWMVTSFRRVRGSRIMRMIVYKPRNSFIFLQLFISLTKIFYWNIPF